MSSGNVPQGRKPERDALDDPRQNRQPPASLTVQEYVWPGDDQIVGSPMWCALLQVTPRQFHERFAALAIPGFGSKSVLFVNAKDLRLALSRQREAEPEPPPPSPKTKKK